MSNSKLPKGITLRKDGLYMGRFKYQNETYIKKELGMKRLSQVKPIMLQRHFNQMAADDYSTKTIADTYNVLHSMFKLALQNSIIFQNPCDAVILPKTKEKDRRVLTIEEQKEVLEHAKGRICEQLVRVALGTGMRAGELQGLTWNDIDFQNREIHINKTLVYIRDRESGKYCFKFQSPKTKSGSRTIPMQEDVYQALRRQRVQLKEKQIHATHWNHEPGFDNLVFLNITGRPRQGMDFRNDLERIEKAINKDRKKQAEEQIIEFEPIPHFYPHSLRHTFATRCFEAGIEAKTVQKYLGHASIAITMDLYTHVTEDKARAEMEKLNQLYQSIG